MARIATLTALVLLAGPALAAGETPFETVKGWAIERTAPGAKGPACLMSTSYKDAEDDDAENALVFALAGDQVVISFIYEHWEWEKNETLRVPLMLDKKVALAKSTWTGDGQTLTAVLPASLVPGLLAAKTLVLKLDGADADFRLAGFAQAYDSLRRCESTPAQTAAAAPPVAAAPVAPPAAVAAPEAKPPADAKPLAEAKPAADTKPPAAAPAPAPAPAPEAGASSSRHIEKAMTFPGDGDVPPQSVFARDTPKILVGLAVRDVKPADTLTATWIAVDTDASPKNFKIASVGIPLGQSPTVSTSLSKPDAGWPPGQYRVDFSWNGGPVEFSQSFSVKP